MNEILIRGGKLKMLFGLEPSELIIREPLQYIRELPPWGRQIVDFVGQRVLLEAKQITQSLFGSGNRTGMKKLFELSQADFLTRYELFCLGQEKPIIAYSLGLNGMRATKRVIPQITINKVQEYIIANEFIFTYENELDGFRFYLENNLLIGEFIIENNRFAIWAPRESEHRIKSLQIETSSHDGVMVIAPNIKQMRTYSEILQRLNLNKPLYFTTDMGLDRIWQIQDELLVPLELND